ncbi:cytochrome c biogenesis protein [Daejeonella sp.]|jgi:heme exporter protein C|uniref:cytochrome c biogenesis protein n=1 Tax=Daejeonella sp. TaxID=2805397 RepID=UPI0027BA55FB|nr:cytochrome c biogenesis protein [Daejeonella sp.]
MNKNWWKILATVLVLYSIIAGFLFHVPAKPILNETIRNIHFHVPMWFSMIVMLTVSFIYSIRFLNSSNENDDLRAVEFANVGIVFGVLGLVTGAVWAKFTWGEAWSNDPKQNSAAIALLVYLAYLVLRNALEEEQKRGRISAVYNIFAFPIMVVLLFILPRMTDSLHPGNGGNPGFNTKDMAPELRPVFYPAVLGWILMSTWIATIRYRIRKIENKQYENN